MLDLRRISNMDAPGAVGLARLRDSLAQQGKRLLLAGVTHSNRHGQALRAYGVLADSAGLDSSGHPICSASGRPRLAAVADPATDWAESILLQAAEPSAVHALTVEVMATLQREDPALAAQLYRNLALHLSERLRSAAAAWWHAAG